MSVANFIPTIWSETLYEGLVGQCIAVKNCNREFEGDIGGIGSEVKIVGIGDVNIQNYTPNSTIGDPDILSDSVRSMSIDHARYFNFMIDDVNRVQASPKLMGAALKNAARGLANVADKEVLALHAEAANSIDVTAADEENLLNPFIEARNILYKNNVTDSSEVVFEVSPDVAARLFKDKMELVTNNNELLENGCLGSIMGCKVYVSGNVAVDKEGSNAYHRCIARTKRAIAFAQQLQKIEAYRPEGFFADAVKGLYLYGMKVVYPTEMVRINVNMGAAD
ncbi:MAG: hypothetical protein J6B12_06060 [Clostridia bacterium]|nr:hypothetical protein [Clostridia bacterium]